MTGPELTLVLLMLGWLKKDMMDIKKEFAMCPRHGAKKHKGEH